MKCVNCNKQFEPKRKTAKYCSSTCRKLAFLNKNGTQGTLKKGTLKRPKGETDKDRIGKAIQGYCHGCGRNIKTICIDIDTFA